ncbi:MAG: GDSL-type esterase/lipase family protein [Pseudomonadota bacterium]
MKKMRLLQPILLTLLFLFCIEAALEYRHYRLGWDTPLFGDLSVDAPRSGTGDKKQKTFGPTSEFPFRSRILTSGDSEALRIWVASASHAEHIRLPVKRIFPNLICEAPIWAGRACEVINGSKAGIGVEQNIEMLQTYAGTFQPDVVLLYQGSQIIAGQQKSVLESDDKSTSAGNAIVDFAPVKRLFQETSAYQHLTDYIGGNLKLNGPLKDKLPAEMEQDFAAQIGAFLRSVREQGAEPVLMTFAASHSSENLDDLPRSIRTSFVRYSSYLSPEGWAATIERYNEQLREIARAEGVALIDLEADLHGDSDFFVDYVHFNEAGHERVAQLIAEQLFQYLDR